MAQRPPSSCPNCDFPLTPGQRFCSNCGMVVDEASNNLTRRSSESAASPLQEMATQTPAPTPPPPSFERLQPPTPPYQGYQSPQPGYQPQMPMPDYAVPKKDSSGSVLRQIGCGMGLVILVILLICGGAGYFAYNYVKGMSNTSTDTSSQTSTGSSVTNTDASPTAAPITTLPMNVAQAVTYAGVKLTLLDVKQSASFLDDSSSSKPGVVRVDFKEENASTRGGNYAYSDVMRIVLPDGSSVTPLNAKMALGPDASTTRTNWVDFPVPNNIKPNQLTLRLATSSEAQMDVPLTGNADLGKYQAKTVTPNKSTPYAGLNWTVTEATQQWSIAGNQADSGMIYVIVTLKLDNTGANGFNAYYGDYIRLKAGNTTAAPTSDSTVPLSVAAGQTNAIGKCIFQVPQGNTDFTLLLLATPSVTGSQQENIPFQIR
jgi:hypothetical protein